MEPKVIPQRELRNNIGEVLRDAEAGVQFTITVRGRPVATLGPPTPTAFPRADVEAAAVAALLTGTPVDEGYAADIEHLRSREAAAGDPWPDE